ncbi:hypothetical protein [Planobispora longispora]|uniref:Uncharacterized protein n=1 Tax=Planobispora longispora TaxID=28887 RepID=A0A8J3RJM7_9ACTN|nr:hypothetical protein [Planobispora longispora]GIH76169.1 hypothetical protein Plo01_25980 [Planobispora longispora]
MTDSEIALAVATPIVAAAALLYLLAELAQLGLDRLQQRRTRRTAAPADSSTGRGRPSEGVQSCELPR